MSQCPSCANPIPPGSRFCPTCGAAVASSSAEERRVVTVLFADLVGFTSLSEHLDPEQVKRLIDASFQILVNDITAFGGTVDKLIGDGIVALFGVPVAHEDDAERAVRAALRMQESLAQFANSRIATDVSQSLQMRIGINTGIALVGTVAGTDYTAMGDVVNLASRLQTLAPPGGVLVGGSTHGLTEASIEYEAIGDLSARGREATVPAWLAKVAVAQPGARHRRRDVGIMGRSTELALALASVNFSIMNSQAALLAVDGEGGVGKSRLVDELVRNIANSYSAMVLEGSAVPYGQSNRWWPLASALFDRLEMDVATPLEVVREVGLAQGRELFGEDDEASLNELAEAFLHLLGYPSRLDELDPQAARDAVFRAVALVLERHLDRGPVLLSITDVHWADPSVLALFEHLLVTLARTPFVLVTTNRPDPELLWPPLTTRAAIVRLPLEPLGPISAAQMVRAIIGNDADESTIATIYERSGGNPLFLEELAVLVADGGDVTTLPDSLRAVIAARLDQLPGDQRSAIDNAAVLGPSGPVQSLERFAEVLGGTLEPAVLDGLVDSGLLSVSGRRWSFKSDSVREVAYNTLTKAVRAVRHVGVARSMQDRDGNLDDIAHHLAAAAEIVAELGPIDRVPPTIRDEALVALEGKVQRASDQGNLRQIARSCLRAIDLFPEITTGDLHRRLSLLRLRRIGALVELRLLDKASVENDLVLADALMIGDQVIEAGSRRVQGLISQAAGDLPTARIQLGDAIDLFREIGDRPQLAETLRLRGFLELFGGSLSEAEWLFGEAAGLYADLGDRRGLGYIEQHRAWMSFLGGHMAEAETHLTSAADTLNELGDRAGVGWAFGLLAYVKFFGRHFDEAETLANVVRAEAKERGDEWAEAMMMSLLASMRLWTGNLDAAIALAEHARAKFKRLGDGFGLAQALGVLGRTQVALGDPNLSRTTESLLSSAEPFGESPYPLLAAAGISMHAGDGKAAVMYADEAIARMRHIAANASEPFIIRAVGQAQIGDFDSARESLEHLDGDMSDHPFAQSANALVAVLEGRPDAAIASAQLVADANGHTYLDGVVARLAAGAACAMLGDSKGARRWLSESVAQATATQDGVATALALLAYQHVLGVVHEHGAGDQSALGVGWRNVIDALPHLELVAEPG
ncbi:MAG: adenylate/guanylate cyclase domain-containing protein [Ilumatobacteraceae bacterium]